ncbi:MAG: methyltransferase domain-containing protein [Phycisphaerae bacterium]|nr:methyltransferase domain-containing protein [Phycisphaerae bacterium]
MSDHLERWLERDGERFLAGVGLVPGSVVVDFGCRIGTYTLPAARLVGASGKVYAVERKREVLDELMRTARLAGLDQVCHIDTRGDLHVPLADETVDAALLYDVIHLIGWVEENGTTTRRSTAADRRELILEMHRIVKPGGLLSVYANHLETHTDVMSDEEIRAEIEAGGFAFRDDWKGDLIHDEKLVSGHVMNFTRAGQRAG